jgi:excisionase family DNA binding protein
MQRKLTAPEITTSLVGSDLPPILTPEEAAGLLRLKVSTLYRHVSEGRYSGAVKRGKPLRFWRDRLIQEFMR